MPKALKSFAKCLLKELDVAGHVFISYSSKDSEKAQLLTASLERDGFQVWRDQDKMQAGAQFTLQLEQAILRAQVVVLLVTTASKSSRWVMNEIVYALDAGKQIIPLMLESGLKLPFPIYTDQYIDVHTSWQSGYGKLLVQLREQNSTEMVNVVQDEPEHSTVVEAPLVSSLSTVEPFLYGSYVPKDLFVGRAAIMDEIRGRLANITMQSISIVGNRRIGKTSLLRYVTETPSTCLTSRYKWITLYVDMMDARTRTLAGLMRLFRRNIARSLQRELWSEADDGNLMVLAESIEELANTDFRLVICFDEWESAVVREELDPFIETLRWAGSQSYVGMIVASAHTLINLTETSGLTSPFHNIFKTTFLGLMPDDEWIRILKDGFSRVGERIDQHDIDFVRQLAGGHPYLTQMIGALLWESRRNGWSERYILEKYAEQAQAFFSQLWQRQDKVQNDFVRSMLGITAEKTVPKSIVSELVQRGVLRDSESVFCRPFAEFVLQLDQIEETGHELE